MIKRKIRLIICLTSVIVGICAQYVFLSVKMTPDIFIAPIACVWVVVLAILLCDIITLVHICDRYADIVEEIEAAHILRSKKKAMRRLIHRLYHKTKDGGSTCDTCFQREQCREHNGNELKYANDKLCYCDSEHQLEI